MTVSSYRPNTDFGYVCTVTFGFGDMTCGQGHDTPLIHWQQYVKYYPDQEVRSYGPDTKW